MNTKTIPPRKLALVGVGLRSMSICRQMPAAVADRWQVSALWDVDPRRFEVYAENFPDAPTPKTYLGHENFARLLTEQRPDLAFIATRDSYHAEYIIACLEAGVDVVVEKPMVTDSAQARAVLEAEARSSATIRVGFNYRYQAAHSAIKRELDTGKIGRVTAVEMAVYLAEAHGSSYFQRWNRYRAQSGGLTIHKAGHFLDLLQWWIGQKPVELFGYSALNYYGPDGEMNPSRRDGRRCRSCDEASLCAYQQTRERKAGPGSHYRAGEGGYTGYNPDACIFDSDIDIEDTYASVIRYDGTTMATFSVNFSSPFEQFRVVFNGTRGRLEYGYAFGKEGSYDGAGKALVHYPLFSQKPPEVIPVVQRAGGHGGADPAMLEDIFTDIAQNTCRASSKDGAYAVALGEAMWRSPKEHRPIRMDELLKEWY